jgi:nuclear pore complex protein Nup205
VRSRPTFVSLLLKLISIAPFADFDGFLPPATERHHQLLLPALQLVVNTLVSFGADTSVATRQALAFISGQRENLLIALKDAAVTQTVPLLREAHLIVTLLGIVLPTVAEEDFVRLTFPLPPYSES